MANPDPTFTILESDQGESTWLVVKETDLADYLVSGQLEALKSAALAVGQTDPFDRVMEDIAQRIRAEVRACRRNRVSVLTNSIPPDLKAYACMLIIEAMNVRLSIGIELTTDQKTQCSEARKYLARIAKCEVPIAQPSNAETEEAIQRAGSIQMGAATRSNSRVTTRDRLRNL